MKTAGTEQMREIDRVAIEEYGIPSLELMEHAARHVTDYLLQIENIKEKTVLIVCGTGNNGGDGLAVARQLFDAGVPICLYMVGNMSKCTQDSLANQKLLSDRKIKINIYEEGDLPACDYVVDALFGVGLNREITGKYRAVIEAINKSGLPVVSCDIPSGINGDSGEICGLAVKADTTVTFTCSKPGLEKMPGSKYAGRVIVVDIGIPEEITEKVLDSRKIKETNMDHKHDAISEQELLHEFEHEFNIEHSHDHDENGAHEHAHKHSHHHSEAEKKRQLNRISRIIGHLQYVKRLIEEDADCAEVLMQLSASKSATNGLAKEIINEHIAHCITHAIENGDTEELEEFKKAIEKFM